MTEFQTIRVERADQFATITIVPRDRKVFTGPHVEIGAALQALRFDNDVRVIVLTGQGDSFFLPPKDSPRAGAEAHSPGKDWDLTQGLQRTFQQIVEVEKPIIAKVNGHAIGFGSSLVFACDFIVACEDAIFCDHHLGMGRTINGGRTDFGSVPGDGGTCFVPLHMAPCIAKEYLWLAREMTGRQLAAAGVINAAVPAAELDARVEAIVRALLLRTPHSLALAKRALNRFYADAFNRVFDLAWAYEMVNFYAFGRARDGRGETTL